MARRIVIGGNWKMHLNLAEAKSLASEVRNRVANEPAVDVIVFPAAPFLVPVIERLHDTRIGVGAQDVHTAPKGAFTGAVSAEMLISCGCSHVLIGHSERRHVFGDDDATVAIKLQVALAAGLTPVLCVGEKLSERRASETFAVCDRQLQTALAPHTASALSKLIVAYEPVWAIGTGETATPEQAQEVHAHIRSWLAAQLGPTFAENTRLQYGGSVKASNAEGLLGQPDIDGALVGGASLQADDFAGIVRARMRR